jgi:SHS2 domain-containing protein
VSAQDQRKEGYRFLEHVTDAYIEAWGPTLETAFGQAARGLYETMLNSETIDGNAAEEIHVDGHDKKELLYNWLEELLLDFDIKQMVYQSFDVKISSQMPTLYQLRGMLKGEKYNQQKHGAKTEVKGVTYHLMEIQENADETRIRFILDL